MGVRKATAKGGLGERLLKSMGWSEGKGLGRQEDGISSALVVKKKDDAAGVAPLTLLGLLLAWRASFAHGQGLKVTRM